MVGIQSKTKDFKNGQEGALACGGEVTSRTDKKRKEISGKEGLKAPSTLALLAVSFSH